MTVEIILAVEPHGKTISDRSSGERGLSAQTANARMGEDRSDWDYVREDKE